MENIFQIHFYYKKVFFYTNNYQGKNSLPNIDIIETIHEQNKFKKNKKITPGKN